MIYIIKTQMNRSIEEITFDHNHERITEHIEKGDKNNFRRTEKKLMCISFSYVFLFVPFMYVGYPYLYIY